MILNTGHFSKNNFMKSSTSGVNKFKAIFFSSLFTAAIGIFLSSCLKSSEPTPLSMATITFINASPLADSCGLIVNGTTISSPFMFGDKTGYYNISTNTNNFQIVKNNKLVVNKFSSVIEDGKSYTSFIIHKLDTVSLSLLLDTLATPPSGKARLRFAHVTYNAPGVDVAFQGGKTLGKNITFLNASSFIESDTGTFVLEVKDAKNISGPKFLIPNVKIEANKIYTIWTTGSWNTAADSTKFNVHLSIY
jgi:hypothetical protein